MGRGSTPFRLVPTQNLTKSGQLSQICLLQEALRMSAGGCLMDTILALHVVPK